MHQPTCLLVAGSRLLVSLLEPSSSQWRSSSSSEAAFGKLHVGTRQFHMLKIQFRRSTLGMVATQACNSHASIVVWVVVCTAVTLIPGKDQSLLATSHITGNHWEHPSWLYQDSTFCCFCESLCIANVFLDSNSSAPGLPGHSLLLLPSCWQHPCKLDLQHFMGTR